MTLKQRLILLAQAIGADIKALNISQGALTDLGTTTKTSLVAAVNELKGLIDGLTGSSVIDDGAGDGALLFHARRQLIGPLAAVFLHLQQGKQLVAAAF